MLLVVACGGEWVVEQPVSSLITLHERFQWMLRALEGHGIRAARCNKFNSKSQCSSPLAKVYQQSFWMKAFGHPTPKRSFVVATTDKISRLNTGHMRRNELQAEIQTTKKYINKAGKVRFAGTKALKGTQLLGG